VVEVVVLFNMPSILEVLWVGSGFPKKSRLFSGWIPKLLLPKHECPFYVWKKACSREHWHSIVNMATLKRQSV